jgi:hypothetical protein
MKKAQWSGDKDVHEEAVGLGEANAVYLAVTMEGVRGSTHCRRYHVLVAENGEWRELTYPFGNSVAWFPLWHGTEEPNPQPLPMTITYPPEHADPKFDINEQLMSCKRK